MHSKNQRIVLIFSALVVGCVIAIPFFSNRGQRNEAPVATLPMGLLLNQQDGDLTVVDALADATRYGLKPGDVIASIDGQSLSSVDALRLAIADKEPGDLLQMVVVREQVPMPIHRHYRGDFEVPAPEQFTAQLQQAELNPPIGTTATSQPSAASFGLQVAENAGRVTAVSVDETSASYAYGVRPGDVLFQINAQRISSEADFQNIAATKVSGDVVNLMLVRNENIVLVQNMKLGARGEQVVAPVGYVATVHPFVTLKKDALQRLLGTSFATESNVLDMEPISAPTSPLATNDAADTGFVINTGSDSDNSAIEDFEAEVISGLAGPDTPIEDLVRDAVDTASDLAESGLEDTDFTLDSNLIDVDSNGESGDEVIRVADVTNRIRKPNAVPKFDNFAGVSLPDVVGGVTEAVKTAEEVAQDFISDTTASLSDTASSAFVNASEAVSSTLGAASEVAVAAVDVDKLSVARNEKTKVAELSNTVVDSRFDDLSAESSSSETGPSGRFSALTQDEWSSSRRPRGATDYMAGSKSGRFIDRGTTLKIASEPVQQEGEAKIINRIQVQAEDSGNADVAIQDPPATPDSTDAASTEDPFVRQGTESVTPPAETHDGDQPMQLQSGEVVMEQPGMMPGQPVCSSCSQCTSCNDWGCGSCGQGQGTFNLNNHIYGNNCQPAVSFGGWFQLGYHTQSNDLFNDRPNEINLHQGWLFAEKAATHSSPLGFRADVVYGIDGADTQSFGNTQGEWDFDNGFDFGSYSWAIPQLYAELLVRDWTIKLGHFFTIAGYETVTAPDNFFYSHAMTMYNSEPFTHTGILASKSLSEQLEIYAGWTLGWDTGFDQLNDGSTWLGGFSYSPSNDISFTYVSTAGNLGSRGDDAYSHSLVLDLAVTNSLTYVVQSDVLRVDGTGEDNFSINQYLLYNVNDKVGVGARVEWWKGDLLTFYAPHGGTLPSAGSLSYYAATFGVNYRPRPNIITRPEVRYDWSPAADYNEFYFGIDAILTF